MLIVSFSMLLGELASPKKKIILPKYASEQKTVSAPSPLSCCAVFFGSPRDGETIYWLLIEKVGLSC